MSEILVIAFVAGAFAVFAVLSRRGAHDPDEQDCAACDAPRGCGGCASDPSTTSECRHVDN